MTASFVRLAALAVFLVPAGAMTAVAAAPVAVMKARHHNFEVMGRAMKGTADQLKSARPKLAVIRTNAATLSAAAAKVGGHFPVGSGPESGRKTEALPAIWQRPGEFAAATRLLVDRTRALEGAAGGGDLGKVRAAFGGVGASCKGCHDDFRKGRR